MTPTIILFPFSVRTLIPIPNRAALASLNLLASVTFNVLNFLSRSLTTQVLNASDILSCTATFLLFTIHQLVVGSALETALDTFESVRGSLDEGARLAEGEQTVAGLEASRSCDGEDEDQFEEHEVNFRFRFGAFLVIFLIPLSHFFCFSRFFDC